MWVCVCMAVYTYSTYVNIITNAPKNVHTKGMDYKSIHIYKVDAVLSVGSVFCLHKNSVILKYLLLMTLFLLPFCVLLSVYVRFIKLFIDKILTVHNLKICRSRTRHFFDVACSMNEWAVFFGVLVQYIHTYMHTYVCLLCLIMSYGWKGL